LAATILANFKPVRGASYLASLFVVGNCSLTAYFMASPSSDMRTTPTPQAFLVADPSIWIIHVLLGDSSSSRVKIQIAYKTL